MLHNVRAVTSMVKRLIFHFKLITIRCPYVIDSDSVHDKLLFTVDCFSAIAQQLSWKWKYFIEFVSGLLAPEFLPECANVYSLVSN